MEELKLILCKMCEDMSGVKCILVREACIIRRTAIKEIKDAGYVKLTKDQSSLDNPHEGESMSNYEIYERAKLDMFRAGWRKVELEE